MRPYEFVLCPNQLNVKESFQKKRQGPKDDILVTSSDDNEASLSCEDQTFLQVMEAGEAEAAEFVHRNCYVDDANFRIVNGRCHFLRSLHNTQKRNILLNLPFG